MAEPLIESVQRLVVMEADLARLVERSEQPSDESTVAAGLGDLAEITARLIANQRQVIETLIVAADEIARLKHPGR